MRKKWSLSISTNDNLPNKSLNDNTKQKKPTDLEMQLFLGAAKFHDLIYYCLLYPFHFDSRCVIFE